jgi:shikimate dehydrogenase
VDFIPDPSTRLFAVLGSPISHSRSPAIMNGLFRARGMNCLYLGMEVRAGLLGEIIRSLYELPFDGLNLTYPLKEEAVSLCTDLSETARRVGAVNTLTRGPEGWRGETTDGAGLLLHLQEGRGWTPAGTHVVVLGAGGAARSALATLGERDLASLTVVTRSARRYQGGLFPWLQAQGADCLLTSDPRVLNALARADLLLHATPFGLAGRAASPCWDLSALNPAALVVDMNYDPRQTTPFLKLLGGHPLREDGQGMLAGQAVLGFRIWTGQQPEVREALQSGRFDSISLLRLP